MSFLSCCWGANYIHSNGLATNQIRWSVNKKNIIKEIQWTESPSGDETCLCILTLGSLTKLLSPRLFKVLIAKHEQLAWRMDVRHSFFVTVPVWTWFSVSILHTFTPHTHHAPAALHSSFCLINHLVNMLLILWPKWNSLYFSFCLPESWLPEPQAHSPFVVFLPHLMFTSLLSSQLSAFPDPP